MKVHDTLLDPSRPIEAVYFVERGWISMVAHLDGGMQAEVGLVGPEGIVGLPLVMGVSTIFADTYVQADGEALSMEAGLFKRELEQHPALFQLLLRYSEARQAHLMQSTACNGHHSVEQRLARWILMAHDRTEGDELRLTHEFLSIMLCVQRQSVTVAARALQRAGLIRYAQGHIVVLDRAGLEDASCACYRAVQDRFEEVLQ
jgi:CRP-like cAMP-binding protein